MLDEMITVFSYKCRTTLHNYIFMNIYRLNSFLFIMCLKSITVSTFVGAIWNTSDNEIMSLN